MSQQGRTRPLICHVGLEESPYNPREVRAVLASAERYDAVIIGPTTQTDAQSPSAYKGIPVWLVKWRTRQGPKNLPFRLVKYAEFLIRTTWRARRLRADLIHAHALICLPSALLAALGRKTKVIYDAYELYSEQGGPEHRQGANFRFWMWLERRLARRADAVIAANPERGEIMCRQLGLAETPVSIDNLSEPLPRVESRLLQDFVASKGGSAEAIVFYQGMINENRGVPNLIAAMAHVPKGISLVLMGPQHDPVVEPTVARYGLQDRVFYHDPVPSGEVHAWSCSADAGVVIYRNTGLNNYLCAPNKLYQYLMSGIPVIGPDSPTVRRVLADCGVGTMCDPESPESIAKAIMDLLGDKASLERARASIPKALEKFNWQNEKERLLGLYDRLLTAGTLGRAERKDDSTESGGSSRNDRA